MNIRPADTLRALYVRLPLKRQLFQALRRMYQPPERLYQHLYFRGPFTSDTAGIVLAMYNHDSSLETGIFWAGLNGFEPVSLRLWGQLCRRSSIIFDIGANTGVYSLAAKAFNPAARVFAFEPIERFHQAIVDNAALNGFEIEAENLAVSNQDAQVCIYDLPFAIHRHASLIRSEALHAGETVIERSVQAIRLDTYMQSRQLTRVDLIKIDVEGHEPAVLEGLGGILASARPSVLLEIKSRARAAQIEKLCAGLGHLTYRIDEMRGPQRLDSLAANFSISGDSWNHLLCTPAVAAQLQLP